MSSKEIVKEYSNDEITIVWQPTKCIHAAECVKALPEVYNPKIKPWIKIENATTEALKAQVDKCPTGALSYHSKGESDEPTDSHNIKIEALENGPLLVYGTLSVTNQDGKVETKSKTTAFCRCGQSANKPYCDGAHIKAGFVS